MPESDAHIPADGGKTVTITIAELVDGDPPPPPPESTNNFVIQSGKYILTITIAE